MRILGDRFGHSLIDRFVEPDEIVDILGEKRTCFGGIECHPELDDTGPKGTVFRNHLIDVEPVRVPERNVNFRGTAGYGTGRSGGMGLVDLVLVCLMGLEIPRDKLQDLADVVLQGQSRHTGTGRIARLRKVYPLCDNVVGPVSNEIGESEMFIGQLGATGFIENSQLPSGAQRVKSSDPTKCQCITQYFAGCPIGLLVTASR